MQNVFPNAVDARNGARNNALIYGEIRAIETVVLEAIGQGLLSTNVPSGSVGSAVATTLMTGTDTTGQSYCAVWQGTVIDRSKLEQMEIVIQYFTDLGYTIRRVLGVSGTHFTWQLLW